MNPSKSKYVGWLQTLVERALGVKIYRHPPLGRYFYPQLSTLRSWTSDDVIFDVGANDGRTVLQLRQLLPAPVIYAFEPVRATYEELVERTVNTARVHPFNIALGAEPGVQRIYLHEHSVMNSFASHGEQTVGSENVSVATLDQVMAEYDIPFVHFLKIDTEGHELAVLEGARTALDQARIAIIQVEVGFDQIARDFASFEEIRQFLLNRGYYFYGIFNQCLRNAQRPGHWGAADLPGYRPRVLAYCDAVFLCARL